MIFIFKRLKEVLLIFNMEVVFCLLVVMVIILVVVMNIKYLDKNFERSDNEVIVLIN